MSLYKGKRKFTREQAISLTPATLDKMILSRAEVTKKRHLADSCV